MVPENVPAPREQMDPVHIPHSDPPRLHPTLFALLAKGFAGYISNMLVGVSQLPCLQSAIHTTTEEVVHAENTAGWIMQPNLPLLHLVVHLQDYCHRAVLQEFFSGFETLCHGDPDVTLLFDCQMDHDVDHLVYQKFWEGRVSGEADNNI